MQPSQTAITPIRQVVHVFSSVVIEEGLDTPELQHIAEIAGIDFDTLEDMYICMPVRRAVAEKVLCALNTLTKEKYTLSNVRVNLIPSFSEVCDIHQIDALTLMRLCEKTIPYALIERILCGQAVSQTDALSVLQAVNAYTGATYTLENTDIELVPMVVEPS